MNFKKIKKKEKRPQVKKLSQKKANKVVLTGICLLIGTSSNRRDSSKCSG